MTAVHLDGSATVSDFTLTARLEIAAGDTVAILGPNGAGKSTLVRVLAGLQPLTSGRLHWGSLSWDEPSSGQFVPAWQRQVGVLFQDHRLLPHLSALDNVCYPLRCRRAGSRNHILSTAMEWLDQVGVASVAGRKPAQLSGGEAQRVALARLLASRPEVILLDEPTTSLDVNAAPAIRSLLAETLAQWQVPVMLVTHDSTEADQLASRQLRMSAGTLLE